MKKVLVIAGCDRRGTAYGVFTLSEAIGVSPLYWWADVPTKRKSQLYVEHINYVSQAPSVQYRGIFINDEGWGITPWAGRTFDKELGDIGPKCILLRALLISIPRISWWQIVMEL